MERVIDVREGALLPRIHLRAVFSGVVVALVLELCFLVLGSAIGLSVFGANAAEGTAKGVGIGAVVWLLVTLCISMFVGAMIAAEVARSILRRDGIFNALVSWASVSLIGLFLVGSAIAGTVSSTLGLAHQATSVAAQSGQLSPGEVQPPDVSRQVANAQQQIANPSTQAKASRGVAIGMWGLFLALVLPGIAAIVGGVVGASSDRKELEPEPIRRRPDLGTHIPQPT